MALEKTGYTPAITGTTKVRIAKDENGYITDNPEEAVASGQLFKISQVSAENSLQDNTDVIEFFMTLAKGVQGSETNTMSVTWEV